MNNKSDLSKLRETLPAMFSRSKAPELLGGFISKGYLQNLDSAGLGPPRVKCGRKCGYLRDDFVDWLESRMAVPDEK